MQCQRCQFENMPGLERCMRCGSVLGSLSGPIPVSPPRMAKWKRPFRGFLRFFRLSGIQLPKLPPVPQWAKKFIVNGLIAAIISILPGLVQLLTHRFRTIVWYWLAWLVLLAMTLFFWRSGPAMLCLGLALAIHVWIAMRAGFLEDFREFGERILGFIILLVIYCFVYLFGSQYLLRTLGIQAGYSMVNAGQMQIEIGDYLVGRSRNFTVQRGDLIYTRLRGREGYRGRVESSGFVRIIGLPGEKLEIRDNVFIINDKPLDSKEYPVPAWLRSAQGYSVQLSEDSYFIIAQFRSAGNIRGLISDACIYSAEDFQARAFLRWLPIRRRGFIENNP